MEGGCAAMGSWEAVEEAKRRCKAVSDRIQSFNHLTASCKHTLLRLLQSELAFLNRLPRHPPNNPSSLILSVNVGHLEAVTHILQQPFVTGVSRVCKPIPMPPAFETGDKPAKGIHVDIVCTLNGKPVWFIVSDRNPKYISWGGDGRKGLRARIEQVLSVAQSSAALRPASLILFFSNGLENGVSQRLRNEFGALNFEMDFSYFDCGFDEELKDDWIDVYGRSFGKALVLEIKLACPENAILLGTHCGFSDSLHGDVRLADSGEQIDQNLGASFQDLISQIKFSSLKFAFLEDFALPEDLPSEAGFVNFDTTALVAIVSGISNGNTEKLLATPEEELRSRFKSNYEFVIAQVMSEIKSPIHKELGVVVFGKRGIICESVCSEFKGIVAMCGGPKENLRANFLLKQLTIVPDSPSVRMMSLPTTRKLALKNKVVFGTGDYWHAPTLTANMAFVRAISQTGMSLFTLEHRPRALTGD
ncbi:hypothetical protein RJ640_001971 [Escallonia rubra]|uniref:DUF1308 domain-containing protein n=1 Tax=Escallonia rubra TaxID=112253 RepID=A0AA88UQR6_9ASTE|nr:hypothetical protein RJ640_001971 [Escallonia rubra]